MSPLEAPAAVATLFVLACLAAAVVVIVAERRHTVKRNLRHKERGYTP